MFLLLTKKIGIRTNTSNFLYRKSISVNLYQLLLACLMMSILKFFFCKKKLNVMIRKNWWMNIKKKKLWISIWNDISIWIFKAEILKAELLKFNLHYEDNHIYFYFSLIIWKIYETKIFSTNNEFEFKFSKFIIFDSIYFDFWK